MSNTKAQKRHARKRALERFDLDLADPDIQSLIRQIQTGKAPCLEKRSLRVGVFRVTIKDVTLAAVYDKNRKTIVTVMPLEWVVDPGCGQ
jgi:hypothetical protein